MDPDGDCVSSMSKCPSPSSLALSSTRRLLAGIAALAASFAWLPGCQPAPQPAPLGAVFYPPLPQRPRMQFLRSLTRAEDIEPAAGGFASFIVDRDDQNPQEKMASLLVRPYGLAMWEGKLYVCDTGGRKGVIFDLVERKFRTFGQTGPHAFQAPINISIAPGGMKYATDTKAGKVLVFDRDDQVIRVFTGPDGMQPCDAVLHEGELFVSDLKSSSVLVLDPLNGRLLRQIGKRGSGPGQMVWPTNLAFGPGGDLYVCDTLNARVQVFDLQGKLVRSFGSSGLELGKMVRPKGIAVDRDGRLYVADAATDSVQIFDPEGRLLLMLGGAGNNPGDMQLPAKVAISYEGIEYFQENASKDFEIEYLVLVTNQLGPHKVSVYGFGAYRGTVPEEAQKDAMTAPAFTIRVARETK